MFKKKIKLIVFLFVSIFLITSCQPDEDNDIQPISNYKNRITGEWKSQEERTKDSRIINFNVNIEVIGNDTTKVFISNFNLLGYDMSVVGVIQKNDVVIVPDQSSGYTIQGKGSINNNNKTILWEYTVDDGNGAVSYKAEYTKL
ncbi:MAG: hypothetical protein A2X12_01265 [Bacteroidetes bacterium GWE2_29_8]|nr:MAG: hypothetical protein A2X12_01265 [Bacteroidetes bacterium GWE2_29_8]OFY21758.1 MAG: hypothetical protein A2X02_00320 [Bacteroidetes bacterium GWF2_29_10]